jgi:hypothetical protein
MPGTVEIERDGMIYRAQYRIEGAVVFVDYGERVERCELRESDDAYAVAQRLLKKSIAETTTKPNR